MVNMASGAKVTLVHTRAKGTTGQKVERVIVHQGQLWENVSTSGARTTTWQRGGMTTTTTTSMATTIGTTGRET